MKHKLKVVFDFLKNKNQNGKYIKWMLGQAKPYRGLLFVMLLLSIVSLLMSFASTIIGKYVVDATTEGILNARYIIYMASTTVFSILFSAGFKIFNEYVNEKFAFGMRCDMFNRIQRSLWRELTHFHSGDIVTRLTGDISGVSNGIISIVPSALIAFLQLVIAFFILFFYDRPLAFFALIVGPIGALSAVAFREKYKQYQTLLRESESEYRSFMQESLSNIGVVKAFQREENNNAVMQDIRSRRMATVMKSARLGALMNVLMRLIFSLGYVVAFCWGAYRISKGEITYGTMTVFISLVSQVQGSISSMGHLLPQLYSMIISAKRIIEVADIKDEDYAHINSMPQRVSVEFSNVSFAYDADTVLKNVSLLVNSGERVGVVGSSGAGKTTLVRLLLTLVKPDSGVISFIDENEAVETAQPASRRFISYVPQGNTLFSGTIEENLRTGGTNASEQELWEALELAQAADFVRKLPEGLRFTLSERAGGLSEGQAQRIAIARALLRDRPVLILDEATSALDESTESRILGNISEKCSRTCFIITHRHSMLKYCDKVIEIKDEGYVSLKEQAKEIQ